jgi:hypothetical protein
VPVVPVVAVVPVAPMVPVVPVAPSGFSRGSVAYSATGRRENVLG